MRFRLEQRFASVLGAVEDAFVDPALFGELAGSAQLGRPVLLAQTAEGHTARQDVCYSFVGELSAAVTRVVDPTRLTWVEHSVLDRPTHRTTFVIRPDHYADRLTCSGTVELLAAGGGTLRVLEGDLRVRVSFMAQKVEKAIVSGLRDHASAEALAVQAWLDGR